MSRCRRTRVLVVYNFLTECLLDLRSTDVENIFDFLCAAIRLGHKLCGYIYVGAAAGHSHYATPLTIHTSHCYLCIIRKPLDSMLRYMASCLNIISGNWKTVDASGYPSMWNILLQHPRGCNTMFDPSCGRIICTACF